MAIEVGLLAFVYGCRLATLKNQETAPRGVFLGIWRDKHK